MVGKAHIDHDALLRLLCLLPGQSAPARMVHLRADLGIKHPSQLARLFEQLRGVYGVTVETQGQRAWINPASWRRAQKMGLEYVATEAARELA